MNAIVDIEASGDDEAHAAQAIEQIFSSDDDGGASDYQRPDWATFEFVPRPACLSNRIMDPQQGKAAVQAWEKTRIFCQQ
jgi:hypothetical protein